jgi:lipid II:glycine glycyltransferase (peptidoglycan interpeptide bridge formation enzyme)
MLWAPENKKPPGLPAVSGGASSSFYAFASPAAMRCENQKYAKKNGVKRMTEL